MTTFEKLMFGAIIIAITFMAGMWLGKTYICATHHTATGASVCE